MSAEMAEVIAAHQPLYAGTEVLDCTCHQGEWEPAHVAGELAKAGYGNVPEAKAKALRGAASDLAKLAYVVPGAAGREEYESRLAVRRGDTDKWLHSRADMIDALNDPEGHALVQAIHDRKAGQ